MRIRKINNIFLFVLLITNSVFARNFPDTEVDKRISDARTNTGIVLAGSSITWGDGNLHSRFSRKVLDYIMTELSTVCMCNQMRFSQESEVFVNPKQYKGQGKQIDKLNSKVEFDLTGDEVAVCQTIFRTSDYRIMQVKADGVIIGRYTNHNPTIGQETQVFSGTGSTVIFILNHPCTFKHEVRVNGRLLTDKIFDGGYEEAMPEGINYLIIKKFDQNQKPVHAIWFRNAPPICYKLCIHPSSRFHDCRNRGMVFKQSA